MTPSPLSAAHGASETDLFNLVHSFGDMLVERWHDSIEFPADGSLAQFMGLTDDEYAMWVEGKLGALARSLREREA